MSIAQAAGIERWLKRDRLIATLGVFAASSWIPILSGA